MDKSLTGTAYSYIRFSSPGQAGGDSIRRQTEERDKWLVRNPGVTLAPDNVYQELGTSSFRGKHRLDDKAALKEFIRAVESGRVRKGSILIVESFDRLTREEFGDAAEFVLGLVNRGIRIVQLSPVEVILEKPVDLTKALILVVELTRGHGESKRKSDTIGAAWAAKREECREAGKIVTTNCKTWLEVKDEKFVFKPGAKALIRRIFKMTTAGYGCRAIASTLNDEGVPSWTGKPWYDQFIRLLIHGREVLGEYRQARRTEQNTREFDGDPIADYYPRAVTEAEWQAAQVAMKARDHRGARPTKIAEQVNIFQSLMYDAITGQSLHLNTKTRDNNRVRFLVPSGYRHRGETAVSFPFVEFERAVLKGLAEIDAGELFDREEGPDEVSEASAQLARWDSKIQALTEQLGDATDIPEVAKKLSDMNAERKEAAEHYERVKASAVSPLSAALGECRGLVEALDSARDPRDVRVRLRHAISRAVEGVYCVFVNDGWKKLAAVRVQFPNGKHRDYLLKYVARRGRGGPPKMHSMCHKWETDDADELDLRKPADAKIVEELLGDNEVMEAVFEEAEPK